VRVLLVGDYEYYVVPGSKLTLISLCFRVCHAEMGYFRILAGFNVLGIETSIAWATPGYFTTHNWPCSEDGKDCGPIGSAPHGTQWYNDPSASLDVVQRRLDLFSE
jgi:hypothetical protein